MERTLQIEEFLSDLHEISSDSTDSIQSGIESIVGETVPFTDKRVTSVHLFALQIALQIKSLQSVIPFGFHVTQKAIFEYLIDQGLETTATSVDEYIKIREEEERNDLYPLSGVSLLLLKNIIEQNYYNELMDKKTMNGGNFSPMFMQPLVHVITVLVQLSTEARERNMK